MDRRQEWRQRLLSPILFTVQKQGNESSVFYDGSYCYGIAKSFTILEELVTP